MPMNPEDTELANKLATLQEGISDLLLQFALDNAASPAFRRHDRKLARLFGEISAVDLTSWLTGQPPDDLPRPATVWNQSDRRINELERAAAAERNPSVRGRLENEIDRARAAQPGWRPSQTTNRPKSGAWQEHGCDAGVSPA